MKTTIEKLTLVRTCHHKETDADWSKPQKQRTQERRDFLSACEEQAQAEGFRTKRVGSGSYEEVRVYRVELREVEAQRRGVCQACGSSVAVEEGVTSLHGYRRPGVGYVFGQCTGSRKAPANKTTQLTRAILKSLETNREMYEAKLAQVQEELFNTKPMYSKEWIEVSKRQRDLASQLHGTEDYIRHLENTAIPALGTAFIVVPRQ